MKEFFGKHSSQLSEIFWESSDHFLQERKNLIFEAIGEEFMERRAEISASEIHTRSNCLLNCVGFIDGPVVEIAPPGGNFVSELSITGIKENMP